MERENLKRGTYPKFQVHWSVKLLGCAWAIAVVFIVGMVIGGMLSGHGSAEGAGGQEPPLEVGEAGKARMVLDVPCLDQRGDFPTGCESVTAVMALNYAGVDITAETFIDVYLPKGNAPYQLNGEAPHSENGEYLCADPNECFLGDPRTEDGWGCYAPVIEKAVGRVIAEYGSGRMVEDLCGKTLRELAEDYVEKGIPVMVWATQGMEFPTYGPPLTIEGTGERLDWIRPEHCLLLVGEEDGTYLFNDPLEGKVMAYDKKAVQLAYEALGSQALAIR